MSMGNQRASACLSLPTKSDSNDDVESEEPSEDEDPSEEEPCEEEELSEEEEYEEEQNEEEPSEEDPSEVSSPEADNGEEYQSNKEIDEANLYVAHLPHSVNDDTLMELFSPFGNLSNVKLIKDKSTGLSKGYGFVQYTNPINAAKAVAQMNGHEIDGKFLAVRVASCPPPPVNLGLGGYASISHLPPNPNSSKNPTSACPLRASTLESSTDGHQINFLGNLGGGLSPFSGPTVPSTTKPWMPNPASCALPSYNAMPKKEIDETNLFVGQLPDSVNEDKLIELFSPFGNLSKVKVFKDRSTGLSKGCGFVKYINPINAAKAMALMNMHKIDGKMLNVRVAGRPPPPVNLGLDVYGDARHPTSACPFTTSTLGSNTDGHQINILRNLGGSLSPFSGPTVSSTTKPRMANPASCALPSYNAMPSEEIDAANLFVGFLPNSVNRDKLIELFSPFGNLSEAKVIKDKSTGLSKGVGFVTYFDPINAAKAVAQMNGHKIDGKMLAVRVAGPPPPPVNLGLDVCGDARHPTSACPLTASTPGSSTDGHQINSLCNLGGGLSPFSGPTLSSTTRPWIANPAACAMPNKEIDEDNLFVGYLPGTVNEDEDPSEEETSEEEEYEEEQNEEEPSEEDPSEVSSPEDDNGEEYQPNKEIDEANLYVAHLPASVNEDKLIELFSPFGNLSNVKLIKDNSTGLSKGYGFVQYISPINAAKAVAQMKGHEIDGRFLVVRVASCPPPPVHLRLGGSTSISHLPSNPNSSKNPTSACPLTASTPGSGTDSHQINFLGNLGGGLSPFSGPTVSTTTRPWMPNPASCTLPNKEIDEAKLFVGYIPHSVNEDKLIELFSPFGNLSKVKVIKDKSTGISQGYAFVKYTDPINAAKAVALMNGHTIDGKMLAVGVAGRPPPPVNLGLGGSTSISHLPPNLGPVAIPQVNPGSVNWPGPPTISTVCGDQINFLGNLGGSLSPFSGPTASSTTRPWMSNPASCAFPSREIDEANLFVGQLPLSVNGDKLIEMFLPFGNLSEAMVIKDKSTGLSKGCAFVKYIDPINAAKAIAHMNGHKIDGKMIAVGVAGLPPPPVNLGLGGSTSFSNLPCPGPVAIPQVNPGSTSFSHLPLNPGPVAIPQVNPGSTSFSHLPPNPGPVAIHQVNPGSTCFGHLPPNPGPVAIHQVNPGSTSFGHLPPNPGPVAIHQVNPGSTSFGHLPPNPGPVAIHQVNPGSTSFGHLPPNPGPVAIPQVNPGSMSWPGSMLPVQYASSPRSNSFLMHSDPVVGRSSASIGINGFLSEVQSQQKQKWKTRTQLNDGKCFTCRQPGHISSNCTFLAQQQPQTIISKSTTSRTMQSPQKQKWKTIFFDHKACTLLAQQQPQTTISTTATSRPMQSPPKRPRTMQSPQKQKWKTIFFDRKAEMEN